MNVRFPSDFEELEQVEDEFMYYGLPVRLSLSISLSLRALLRD